MTVETLLLLARSRTPADRSRTRLTVGALGLSGAFLLGALRVARLGRAELPATTYSNYIAEPGLRSGLAAILVLLAAITAGLAVQALRLGTAARERRMAALKLAGASSRQVRRLSITDAAMAGLAGGLLAAPIYLVLSLFLSLLPRMAQVLPPVQPVDVLTWIPVVVTMTAAGAVIAAVLHRDDLLPRAEHALGKASRSGVVAGVALVLVAMVLAPFLGYVATTALVVGLAFVLYNLNRAWIRIVGRRLVRSGSPLNLLTGARLVTEARPAARMSTLLGCCGFLIGALANGLIAVVLSREEFFDSTFHVTGFALAIFALLLVTTVAMAALIVGVADQLVDQRRQLACLTALGIDIQFLRRMITRQLSIVGAPALAVGMGLGMLITLGRVVGGSIVGDEPEPYYGIYLVAASAVAALGLVLGVAGGVLAGFLLRNQLEDALDPENLRAA
ncbi:FtsX-like permease family protein [Kribbella sp. NPDC056345]|uniref:FtsX-like permease family protein n=1 Tax=Kribbella sp. NPDC056345 TaxID=3345789 RepID=UPI0035D6B7A5